LKLDIGCGNRKRGDVGVDIKRTPVVDVVADAHYLPFRDCSFDEVVSYECIGYDTGPRDRLRCLREALRVTKSVVRLFTWDDPTMLYELNTLPHYKRFNAYKPTWLPEAESPFFCEFIYTKGVERLTPLTEEQLHNIYFESLKGKLWR